MRVPAELRSQFVLLAMCGVLFALVCPFAPTPIAVFNGYSVLLFVVIGVLVLASILLFRADHTHCIIQPAAIKVAVPRLEPIDLDCVRLC